MLNQLKQGFWQFSNFGYLTFAIQRRKMVKIFVVAFLHAWKRRRLAQFFYAFRQLHHAEFEVLHVKGRKGGASLKRGGISLGLRGYESSDLDVFFQIFGLKEYEPFCQWILFRLAPNQSILFVDAGANIGLATAYCASRIPGLHAMGIEPFQGNCELAQSHASYEGFFRAGLGSPSQRKFSLEMDGGSGGEWGIRTRASDQGEIPCITLKDIRKQAHEMSLDSGFRVLKMDIEGAEYDVIGSTESSELTWYHALLIELHGPENQRRGLIEMLVKMGFVGYPMGEYWAFQNVRQRMEYGVGVDTEDSGILKDVGGF